MNSTGSAVRENERYMQGLEAKVSQFKSAWEALSNSVVNSELVKFIIDLGTGTLKALNTDLGVTISQFGLLTGTLTGAISLGSKFLANLLPGVTGLTTAMTALSTAALPVGAAIAAITVVVMKGYKAWKEYHEEVYGVADDLREAVDEANDKLRESQNEAYATANAARAYLDRLKELEKQSNKTADEMAEYEHVVQMLNELIPNLNLKIDETTGKLNKQTDSIKTNIDAWEKMAVEQSLAQKRSDILSAKAEAEIELQKKKLNKVDIDAQIHSLIGQRTYWERYIPDWDVLKALIENYDLFDLSGFNINPDDPNSDFYQMRDESQQRAKIREIYTRYTYLQSDLDELNRERTRLKESIQVTEDAIKEVDDEYKEFQRLYDTVLSQYDEKTGEYLGVPTSGNGKQGQSSKFQMIDLMGNVRSNSKKVLQQVQFNYDAWLKKYQHMLNMGQISEKEYYAALQLKLDKYTDKSIISTDKRWKAEESIYKYRKGLDEEQRKAYEQLVAQAEQAAQEQARAYKQAFTDWLNAKQYLLNTDQITEDEYYEALKAKNEEYFGGKSEYLSEYRKYAETVYKWEKQQNEEIAAAAKQAHLDEFNAWLSRMEHLLAMGEIQEEDYYEALIKKADEYFKGREDFLETYWKYEERYYSWKTKQEEDLAEQKKQAQEAELEQQKMILENEKSRYEKEKSNLEAVISYVEQYSQKQIDAISNQINALKDEATKIKDAYQEQIDALNEQNSALDKQIEKQKLLDALAKAKQQKKYVFKDGRFQYVDDIDAISSAQAALDEYNRKESLNQQIKNLEKQRDLEIAKNEAQQKSLEDEKKRWQEYKDGWSNLASDYEYSQNQLLAVQQYGVDLENQNWQQRLDNLETFKQKYINTLESIKQVTAQIDSLSSTGATSVGASGYTDAEIIEYMKGNSAAWHKASPEQKKILHEENLRLNELLKNRGVYNEASGTWSHYGNSLSLARDGSETDVLSSSTNLSSAVTGYSGNLTSTSSNSLIGNALSSAKKALSNVINVGNVSLPSVQNAKDFVSELKNLAYQAAYSRG